MRPLVSSNPDGFPTPVWKRVLDLVGGTIALIVTLPLILASMLAVWLCDFRNPLFVSERIGRGGRPFRFFKIRTMVPNASANGVNTTIAGDPRVTAVGRVLRYFKLDELPQFWNVVRGEMSLVGPRPNVFHETSRYTEEERRLLSVLPGVTDYSSIAFADLGDVLAGSADANVAYNQLIRPWKSALGLHYIATMSLANDLWLIWLTMTQMFARRWTLTKLEARLRATGAPPELCEMASRSRPLRPAPPPGATCVVEASEVAARVDERVV
jgi:lipopolysaccharide/colanic/teichoic acid biosynthesis glycosyltransferase